jgi:transcription elongation factor S-II
MNLNVDFNNSLLYNIQNKIIKPEMCAFLSPQQINPNKWIDLLEKQKNKEDIEKNMATTDLYTCRKCGGKKFKIRVMQTRSADEPSTKFVTCLTCHNVFTTI